MGIVGREIYDNLNSLRFAFATALLLALMLTNASVHLREYPVRVQRYQESVAAHRTHLATQASSGLYTLARTGPGELHKRVAPLRFCAEGGELSLSDHVKADPHWWGTGELVSFWRLTYPAPTVQNTDINPIVTTVDWSFIIGSVLSLIAVLFTFDAITREREQGTLRLLFATPTPRHRVLLGKFVGALLSISIPFALAVLINIGIITTSPAVHLNVETWLRLAMVFCVAVVYLSVFLALGLCVSTLVKRSSVSLVVLLLIWITFVVFMPSTLASIASSATRLPHTAGFWSRSWELHGALEAAYSDRLYGEDTEAMERLRISGEYVLRDAAQQEALHAAFLNRQLAQVAQGRAITRLSPVTIVQHLLESFAGTGYERHLQFLANVRQYARQFRDFVVDTDAADPMSHHFIGVRTGMSERAVAPAAVPIFADRLDLGADMTAAVEDVLLLMLCVIVLLSGTYLAFIRCEV